MSRAADRVVYGKRCARETRGGGASLKGIFSRRVVLGGWAGMGGGLDRRPAPLSGGPAPQPAPAPLCPSRLFGRREGRDSQALELALLNGVQRGQAGSGGCREGMGVVEGGGRGLAPRPSPCPTARRPLFPRLFHLNLRHSHPYSPPMCRMQKCAAARGAGRTRRRPAARLDGPAGVGRGVVRRGATTVPSHPPSPPIIEHHHQPAIPCLADRRHVQELPKHVHARLGRRAHHHLGRRPAPGRLGQQTKGLQGIRGGHGGGGWRQRRLGDVCARASGRRDGADAGSGTGRAWVGRLGCGRSAISAGLRGAAGPTGNGVRATASDAASTGPRRQARRSRGSPRSRPSG